MRGLASQLKERAQRAYPLHDATALTAAYLPAGPFNRIEPVHEIEQFAVADPVTHDKYGLGRVIKADDATVVVDFGPQRIRICMPFHKLSKL